MEKHNCPKCKEVLIVEECPCSDSDVTPWEILCECCGWFVYTRFETAEKASEFLLRETKAREAIATFRSRLGKRHGKEIEA